MPKENKAKTAKMVKMVPLALPAPLVKLDLQDLKAPLANEEIMVQLDPSDQLVPLVLLALPDQKVKQVHLVQVVHLDLLDQPGPLDQLANKEIMAPLGRPAQSALLDLKDLQESDVTMPQLTPLHQVTAPQFMALARHRARKPITEDTDRQLILK